MHYLVILAIITIIVVIQLRFFADTKRKIDKFKGIFPKKSEGYKLSNLKDDEYNYKIKEIDDADFQKTVELCEKYNLDSEKYIYTEKDEEGTEYTGIGKGVENALISKIPIILKISVSHINETLKTIVGSINDYIENNKTVSDFHLMKDIVDRNCDAKEEEINTQIPIPLYMGLVGTMAGILVGIMYLWLSGGIGDLLSASDNSGAKGVEALLGGVALAMISSILGIILTTLGSIKFKTAISLFESNKHIFLSWIQAKLLPTLSDNVVGAIREMTGNLENFNKEFAQNTGNLGTALEKVNESYKLQTQLIDAVNKIQEGRTAATNLALLNKLIESSEQIGQLAEYLHNTNDYLANVQALNKKLDDYENRTQFIENASKFYSKHEHWLAENYDDANRSLTTIVGKYNKAIEDIFNEIKTDIEGKRQELGTFIDSQNTALKQSTGDLDKIVNALSELGEVQKAVKAFESAIKGQNSKIDHLAEHIEKLANVKSSGGSVQIQQKTPKWQIALTIVITLSCTVLAVNSFNNSETKAPKEETIQPQSVNQQPSAPAITDKVEVADSAAVAQK